MWNIRILILALFLSSFARGQFIIDSYKYAPSSPYFVSNLEFFWDADNVAGSDAANITTLTDESANGYNLTGNGELNIRGDSNREILFDGTTDSYTISHASAPNLDIDPWSEEITLIFYVGSVPGTQGRPLSRGDGGANVQYQLDVATTNFFGIAANAQQVDPFTADDLIFFRVNASGLDLWVNGVETDANGAKSAQELYADIGLVIGARFTGANDYYNGSARRIAIYSRYLSDTELGAIATYEGFYMWWVVIFLFGTLFVRGQDPLLPTIEATELKACLTCHGFGRYATGGRGGSVIKVTNLNSSGTGSMRDALETSGARTIIPEVDGSAQIISSLLTIENPNYTIAGQAAPGDGFAIYSTNYGIENRASDVIIRHFKFRGSGDNGTTNRSNFRIMNNSASGGNITDIMLDHVSMSWPDADEMNIDVAAKDGFTTSEISVGYSMLYESDRNWLIYQRGHSVSSYRNMLAFSNQRGIRDNYPDLISTSFIGFEQINDILHAWNVAPIQPSLGTRFSAVNNLYTLSSTVTPTTAEIIRGQDDGTGTAANTHAYITGNVNESDPGNIQTSLTPYLEVSALVATDLTGVNLLPAVDLEDGLLPYMGSFYWDRDSEDAAAVSNFTGRTGSVVYDGTLPTLSSGTYPTDTDDDGMSDAFEDLHGLNKNLATDRNDTKQSWTFSGLCNFENTANYTNLEVYLAFLAKDFEMMINGIEVPDGSWTLTAAVGNDEGVRITPATRVGIGAGIGGIIIGGL